MPSIYRVGTKWRAQVRLKNRPPQSEIFTTKAQAQAWAREMEGALHKNTGADHLMLYSELQQNYLEKLSRIGYTKQQVLKKLNEYWKDWRLGEINSAAISDYAIRRQRDGLAPATVLSELAYMGVVLQHGGVLINNQDALRAKLSLSGAIKSLRNIGVVGEGKQRSRRPTEEELLKLKDYFLCRPRSQVPMWEIVLFAIATCMRLGEIVGPGGVVWEDYSDNQRLLTIRARKDPVDPSGFDDTIPLLTGAVVVGGEVVDPCAIIKRQQSAYRRTGRIFPFGENTISAAFTKACKELKIPDLHFHDLRHDGISRLFECKSPKYSIPEVAKVSGHRSWKNLQRYTQIDPSTLHADAKHEENAVR